MAETQKSRIVFMGTPAFARDILAGLLEAEDFEVVAVYTQPDRPAGRGKKLAASPVKTLALEHGLEVRQPLSLKKDADGYSCLEEQQYLQSLAPDFLVVAAYGMILPQVVLDMPRCAPVNVHTSLLPAYRGSAPVQRALMDGLTSTGVSIMKMEAGLDTGPVYKSFPVPMERENAGSLLEKMAALSVPVLAEVLRAVREGRLVPVPQQGDSSYAAKVLAEDGWIDVDRPVALVDGHIRGVTPDPGAHLRLVIRETEHDVVVEEACPVLEEPPAAMVPGQILAGKKELFVACQDGLLKILRLKPKGKKSMDAPSFLNGLRLNLRSLEPVGSVLPVAGSAEQKLS